MAFWLDDFVGIKLQQAFSWKKNKDNGVKNEDKHLSIDDDGSSLIIRDCTSVGQLRLVKAQRQVYTLTDGATSIQAEISDDAKKRLKDKSGRLIQSVFGKEDVVLDSFDITFTHLGPSVDKIRLDVHDLSIPASFEVPPASASDIIPIHRTERVKPLLEQMSRYRNNDIDYHPLESETVNASPVMSSTPKTNVEDQEVTEVSPRIEVPARNPVSSKKRPAPTPSPRRSSHRFVRPRIDADNDVVIQTGVNLNQPMQIAVSSTQNKSKALSSLLKQASSKNKIPSADLRERALRLAGMGSATMAPPPPPTGPEETPQVPAEPEEDSQLETQELMTQVQDVDANTNNAPSEHASRLSATFASQLGFETQFIVEDVGMSTQPAAIMPLPNNTPTSAQPEPVSDATQVPLPQAQVSPPSQPLPSSHSTSLGTSSSHLLEKSSSSVPKASDTSGRGGPHEGHLVQKETPQKKAIRERAPPQLFVKYARRGIPADQLKLLSKRESWIPSKTGSTFPHPNMPFKILQQLDEIAARRAARARDNAVREESPSAATQDSDSGEELPWSQSPPRPDPPRALNTSLARPRSYQKSRGHSSSPIPESPVRNRLQTFRRSTNLPFDSSAPVSLEPIQKRSKVSRTTADLPPDSSAEDQARTEEHANKAVSSPPESSMSDNDDWGDGVLPDIPANETVASDLNPRQLPEFPLSSPESSFRPEPDLRASHTAQDDALKNETDHTNAPAVLSHEKPAVDREKSLDVATIGLFNHAAPHNKALNIVTASAEQELADTIDLTTNESQSHVPPPIFVEDVPISEAQPQVEVAETPLQKSTRRRGFVWEDTSDETPAERHHRLRRDFMRVKKEQKRARTSDIQDPQSAPVAEMNPPVTHCNDAEEIVSSASRMEIDHIEPTEIDEERVSLASKRARIIEQMRQTVDRNHEAGHDKTEPGEIQGSEERSAAEPAGTKDGIEQVSQVVSMGPTRDDTAMHDVEMQSQPDQDPPPPAVESPAVSVPRTSDTWTEDSRTALRVAGLSQHISEWSLWHEFREFRPISAVIPGAHIGNPRDFGYVNFANAETASRALEAKHRTTIMGLPIYCKLTASTSKRHIGYHAPEDLGFSPAQSQQPGRTSGQTTPLPSRSVTGQAPITLERLSNWFGEPTKAVWVGYFQDIDEEQLLREFAQFRPLSVAVKRGARDGHGQARKYGFVNFADTVSADRALKAKHNTVINGEMIRCSFHPSLEHDMSKQRGEEDFSVPDLTYSSHVRPDLQPSTTSDLPRQSSTGMRAVQPPSLDQLHSELREKRGYKGNKKAFENLCRKLLSGDVPTDQWDNFVVSQANSYLPYVTRCAHQGEESMTYEQYWHEELEQSAKPDLFPVLTPAKLTAIINKEQPKVRSYSSPANSSESPQTISGANRPIPTHRPNSAATMPRSASSSDNLRRPIMHMSPHGQNIPRGDTQSVDPSLSSGQSTRLHHLANELEPKRTSLWLRETFEYDPESKILQSEIWRIYKQAFEGSAVALLDGHPLLRHIYNTFPLAEMKKEPDTNGVEKFFMRGLRMKGLKRQPSPVVDAGFKIKGASAAQPQALTNKTGALPRPSRASFSSQTTSLQERHYLPGDPRAAGREPFSDRLPRRPLPPERDRQRSRSPIRPSLPPPRGMPKGKPSTEGHRPRVMLEEVLEEDFSYLPESVLKKFIQAYQSLGHVNKKGNAFSEVEPPNP